MIRLFAIILFALLTYSPDSEAACTNSNGSAVNYVCANEGEAYAQNAAGVAWLRANGHGACTINTTYVEVGSGTLDRLMFSLGSCSTNVGAWYPKAQLCINQPPITGSGNYNAGNQGDIRCYQGCQQVVNEDATSFSLQNNGAKCYAGISWGAGSCPANYVYNTTFAVCTPLAPDADGDGTPDSEDVWPTDPTRTKDTDGDGFADEFDDFPADPTQHTDSDNDGIGDNFDTMPQDPDNGQDSGVGNETDNTSAGGASCSSPPVSSGDAITAQIAYQTWATRCAAETTNTKLDQVKSAIQAQGSNGGSGSVTVNVSNSLDANNNGTPDYLEGTEADLSGEPTGAEALESAAAADARAQDALNSIDSSGFLANSSCPGLPPIHVMGQTFDMSQQVCDQASIFAGLIQAFAMFAAAVIIARGMSY